MWGLAWLRDLPGSFNWMISSTACPAHWPGSPLGRVIAVPAWSHLSAHWKNAICLRWAELSIGGNLLIWWLVVGAVCICILLEERLHGDHTLDVCKPGAVGLKLGVAAEAQFSPGSILNSHEQAHFHEAQAEGDWESAFSTVTCPAYQYVSELGEACLGLWADLVFAMEMALVLVRFPWFLWSVWYNGWCTVHA